MSRSDGRFGGRLPELLAVVAVAIPGLVLTVLAGLVVAILATGLGGSAAGVAWTAFALVVAVGLVGTLLLAALTWLAVGRTRRTVRPRVEDAQVAWFRRARRLESLVPPARSLDLSGRIRPDQETVVAALKRRYVSGDIDEREFEREMERLLGAVPAGLDVRPGSVDSPDASAGERRRSREIERDVER